MRDLEAIHRVSVEHGEHLLRDEVEADRVRVGYGLISFLVDHSEYSTHYCLRKTEIGLFSRRPRRVFDQRRPIATHLHTYFS
jgi:hypothetical protein